MAATSSDSIAPPRAHRPRPAPFLKWAGGKGQLVDQIVACLPAGPVRGTYFEPFVGGGAVFFELVRRGLVERARLFDRNEELVVTYRAVRDEVDAVIAALGRHHNDEEHFYAVRAEQPETMPPPVRAARTIFLNRVGFNGLYRVNAAGRFNVPFGRYKNPTICDVDGLRAASRALQLAELAVADFEDACAGVGPGDLVYLDPPYVPLSRTASFTAYAASSFGEPEHHRLAATFGRVVDSGAFALLSNSDTPFTRALYAGFRTHVVEATRAINSKADKRGVVTELLVQGLRI